MIISLNLDVIGNALFILASMFFMQCRLHDGAECGARSVWGASVMDEWTIWHGHALAELSLHGQAGKCGRAGGWF